MTPAQAEAARLPIMLGELRLPTVNRLWPEFAERADKEGWPAARFLATLIEHELAERVTRRIERHRIEARLPPEKTLATFDFAAVPRVRKAHILALTAGDAPPAPLAPAALQSDRPAVDGSRRGPTSWSSARPGSASRTSPRPSATPSSTTATGSCSAGPATSSSACRPPGATFSCLPPSPSSTSSTS